MLAHPDSKIAPQRANATKTFDFFMYNKFSNVIDSLITYFVDNYKDNTQKRNFSVMRE
jgi:hypothetical protein